VLATIALSLVTGRDILTVLVQDAWLARAGKRARAAWLESH
jgi:hypothetical protein